MAQFVSTTLPAEEQLKALVLQRETDPQLCEAIDAEIYDRFLATHAILVMDMADFSRLTLTQGIIPTLGAIYRMRDTAVPILRDCGGTVLKVEADNVYAIFPNPDGALEAAVQLLNGLNQIDLHASIGIGYGDVLMVGDRDLYGHEMNLTSKLGEDLAADDEILLTATAYNTLTLGRKSDFAMTSQTVSDISLKVYRYLR